MLSLQNSAVTTYNNEGYHHLSEGSTQTCFLVSSFQSFFFFSILSFLINMDSMRHAEMEIVSQCLLRCGLVLYGPRPLPKSLGSRGTEQSRGRGLLVKINMLLNLCERPLSLKVTRLVSCNPENHSVHQQLGICFRVSVCIPCFFPDQREQKVAERTKRTHFGVPGFRFLPLSSISATVRSFSSDNSITVCPDYPTEFLQGFNKIRAYQTLMYQMKIFESYK